MTASIFGVCPNNVLRTGLFTFPVKYYFTSSSQFLVMSSLSPSGEHTPQSKTSLLNFPVSTFVYFWCLRNGFCGCFRDLNLFLNNLPVFNETSVYIYLQRCLVPLTHEFFLMSCDITGSQFVISYSPETQSSIRELEQWDDLYMLSTHTYIYYI